MHRQLAGSGLRTARPHSLAELSWNRAGLGLVLPAYPRADLVAVPRMSASDRRQFHRRQFQCAAKRAVICLFVPCQVMEVQVLPAVMHGLKPGPEIPAPHCPFLRNTSLLPSSRRTIERSKEETQIPQVFDDLQQACRRLALRDKRIHRFQGTLW